MGCGILALKFRFHLTNLKDRVKMAKSDTRKTVKDTLSVALTISRSDHKNAEKRQILFICDNNLKMMTIKIKRMQLSKFTAENNNSKCPLLFLVIANIKVIF